MMNRYIPAVVFDLDGTLADTAADIRRALNRTLAADDLPSLDVAAVRLMIGGGPRLLVSRALRSLGIDAGQYRVDRLTKVFCNEYLRQENIETTLFDGAETCLKQLKSAGTRIGLCSNKPDEHCRKIVAELGVASYFDVVQGSGAGLPRKPDPAPLLRTSERLGTLPFATLYVGDSETDVLTARAAGVPVVLVSYGYTARPASDLGADEVYNSLADITGPSPMAESA
jgi:phosphoglycolate phosphatase